MYLAGVCTWIIDYYIAEQEAHVRLRGGKGILADFFGL